MTETANNFLFQRYTPRAYWLRREKERKGRTRKDPPDGDYLAKAPDSAKAASAAPSRR